MKKLLLLFCLSFGLFVSTTHAAEVDWSFDIRMESDKGDYIGQGESRHFNDENDDHLSFSRYNSQENAYSFEVESFSLGTPLRFVFEWKAWALKKWNYYPAKRYPFNDSYNGISVWGDGRGCNEILWGFYVHEISVNSEGELSKAAIDFVQYCEGWEKGLYGSIRYNSTIKSSCTSNSCDKVIELIEDKKVVSSNSDSDEISDEETQMALELFKKFQQKYPVFYKTCIEPSFSDLSTNIMLENDAYYFNVYACKWRYIKELQYLNIVLSKILGERSSGNEDVNLSDSELRQARTAIENVVEKIDNVRERLDDAGKLDTRIDIVLSALAYVFEIWKLGIEIQLNR